MSEICPQCMAKDSVWPGYSYHNGLCDYCNSHSPNRAFREQYIAWFEKQKHTRPCGNGQPPCSKCFFKKF